MTAGYHTIVCHFGLEGNLRPMKRIDFEDMVKTCVPGNNSNPAKARRLRSFPLPSRFIEPGARKKSAHKINIIAAVVMEEDVIIVTDFSRMAQVHIISSSSFFQQSDLHPGSKFWNTRLWARFRGGPDWNIEREEALEGLDAWRTGVLDAHLLTPIIDVLLDVAGPAAGVGQHLANDLLYCLALHPDTPSFDICSNDETYGELRTFLPQFMSTFASPTFLSRCAGLPNSDNPFIFNEVSNTHFLQGYVLVYRTLEVRMEVDLYNRYQRRGLFDPEHTIGEPYHGAFTPATGEWKVVKVRMFEATQNSRYHVILARPPHAWNAITEATPFKDVSTAGFSTTLGPASFFEPMQNKPDINELRALVHPGQPRKQRTGKRGRPRKAPTLKSIKRLMATPRSTPHQDATSRKRKREDKENEEPTRRKTRSQGNIL
ncbi:hypothetical protein C8R46DRAFT_44716 [Mycena filopes]|nr:hypothetical protein C8R46DRAFT_44716 [Mycena filopes]